MTPAHFILRPKAWAEERYCWGRTMEVQRGLRIWPRTTLCSTSHSAPKRKGEHSAGAVQVKGYQYCNKAFCTWQDHTLQLLQPPPNHSRYGLTGQVLNPRKLSLHVNAGKRINASIKSKERQYRRGGDNPSPKPWSPRKMEDNKSTKLHTLLGRDSLTGATQTTVQWLRPSLSNPCSTNYIVWALYVRAQYHLGVVTKWVPTIGAVCGKGLCVGPGGGTRSPSITSNSLLLCLNIKFH